MNFAKLAPVTKLLLAVVISLWSFLLSSITSLALLIIAELLLSMASGVLRRIGKAILTLGLFAATLGFVQYITAGDARAAAVAVLRMTAMTIIFPLILTTTRLQDIATALVTQCRIPYEYAFMFTAALRFVPDFLIESRAIMDAQQCRGYKPGRGIYRLAGYTAILRPLILGALSRSEAMSMSLEMRGFGEKSRTFYNQVSLTHNDTAVLTTMVLITAILVYRFIYHL